MQVKSLFQNLVKRMVFPHSYSESAYITYLRQKCHIDIGENCRIYSPNHTSIDIQRPHMLHIGDYVKITSGVTILCHDYSRGVFCQMNGSYSNIGECQETYIGDNVFIGTNAIILMGTHIGNNSVVGAGAVVSGCFEDGMVIAGNPARVICSITEMYEKRKSMELEAARLYVKCWRNKYGVNPTVEEMTNAFSWLYLPRSMETVQQYPDLFSLGGVDDQKYLKKFLESEPLYESFQDFLDDCI